MPICTNTLTQCYKVYFQTCQMVAIGMFDPGPHGTGSICTSKHHMGINKAFIIGYFRKPCTFPGYLDHQYWESILSSQVIVVIHNVEVLNASNDLDWSQICMYPWCINEYIYSVAIKTPPFQNLIHCQLDLSPVGALSVFQHILPNKGSLSRFDFVQGLIIRLILLMPKIHPCSMTFFTRYVSTSHTTEALCGQLEAFTGVDSFVKPIFLPHTSLPKHVFQQSSIPYLPYHGCHCPPMFRSDHHPHC